MPKAAGGATIRSILSVSLSLSLSLSLSNKKFETTKLFMLNLRKEIVFFISFVILFLTHIPYRTHFITQLNTIRNCNASARSRTYEVIVFLLPILFSHKDTLLFWIEPFYPSLSDKLWLIPINSDQFRLTLIDSDSLRYIIIRFDTVWYTSIQFDTVWYTSIQFNTLGYVRIRYDTLRYSLIR